MYGANASASVGGCACAQVPVPMQEEVTHDASLGVEVDDVHRASRAMHGCLAMLGGAIGPMQQPSLLMGPKIDAKYRWLCSQLATFCPLDRWRERR